MALCPPSVREGRRKTATRKKRKTSRLGLRHDERRGAGWLWIKAVKGGGRESWGRKRKAGSGAGEKTEKLLRD